MSRGLGVEQRDILATLARIHTRAIEWNKERALAWEKAMEQPAAERPYIMLMDRPQNDPVPWLSLYGVKAATWGRCDNNIRGCRPTKFVWWTGPDEKKRQRWHQTFRRALDRLVALGLVNERTGLYGFHRRPKPEFRISELGLSVHSGELTLKGGTDKEGKE